MEKTFFNFFADVGETIVFGRQSQRVPRSKNILNFFANLGEKLLGAIPRFFRGLTPSKNEPPRRAAEAEFSRDKKNRLRSH